MTFASRIAFVAALGCALAAGHAALAAGPTAQDYETARVLYKEGKEMRAAGNLRGALEKLKAAHALGHTPITGIELAHTQEQLGLLVEARETCLGVGRMPVLSDESQRSAEARDEAAKLADALKPRISAVRIRILGLTAGAVPIVAVDGENVPAISLDEPRKVNPGHHQVTAHLDGGATVGVSVDLGEAQTRDVILTPPLPPAGYVPPPPPGGGEGHSAVHHGVSVLTVLGIVVGGLGLVVGSTSGLVAAAKLSDLKASCPGKECLPAQWQSLDSARAIAAVSTVSFVVAGVGAVMLIIGLATSGHGGGAKEAPAQTGLSVTPELGLGYVGVRGAF